LNFPVTKLKSHLLARGFFGLVVRAAAERRANRAEDFYGKAKSCGARKQAVLRAA
jgi:hypothetical protein